MHGVCSQAYKRKAWSCEWMDRQCSAACLIRAVGEGGENAGEGVGCHGGRGEALAGQLSRTTIAATAASSCCISCSGSSACCCC